jgi:hypothetical protein
MEPPASEVRLAAQIRAHQSWAKTVDRTARTAPARAALERKFLEQAGGDPVRAEHIRTAYYKRLAPSLRRADGATVSAAPPLPVTTLHPDGVALRGVRLQLPWFCGRNLIISTTPSRPPR